jgi:hypothetical protein
LVPSERRGLNADGSYDYWFDVKRNAWGVIRTWAVFWYATIFRHGGLCVSPPQSLTENIGIDGSGENSGTRDIFRAGIFDDARPIRFPEAIALSIAETQADYGYRQQYRPPLLRRSSSALKWRLKRLSLLLQRHSRALQRCF